MMMGQILLVYNVVIHAHHVLVVHLVPYVRLDSNKAVRVGHVSVNKPFQITE